MKRFLIFLVLMIYAVCRPHKEFIRRQRLKRTNRSNKLLRECLLESSSSSSFLKDKVKSTEGSLKPAYFATYNNLSQQDRSQIDSCIKGIFERLHNGTFYDKPTDIFANRAISKVSNFKHILSIYTIFLF